MSLLYPTIAVRRISQITPQMLKKLGIKALMLDVDNTLTTHNNPIPDKDVLVWLEARKKEDLPMVLVSNNHRKRILPFAGELEMEYTANAMKPLTIGFRHTAKRLGLPPHKIGIVGDQIFTDILGGNLFGARTILVEPMQTEGTIFFRLKRRAELFVLKRYRKQRRKPR